ncbi:LysR family transcriptional regulator [Piscinibacter koreensis]|uniref:LysR family transcriptional regulator n=1 Tax=Piscinibacter koreensis TaxID=2742824 RepID=A0A7Y6NKA6_9BURK|nr:LysR family transcriptional regulator [Schlegelella koreensis]NUZ04710.1 LysR family transcriptional regulator [Schlegelella koreensis]
MPASIRQFRAFVLLIDERNFTRAASAMHLSQPAYSALIGALEADLGVRLFDRSKRHVELTPEGAELEGPARRALLEFDSAVASVHDRASLRRGRVSIALLPSLAANWLPDLLMRYRNAHPGISVDVFDVLSEGCIDHVLSGRADFALAATRAETPDLQAELFCADDSHLVCRADHPLASIEALRLRDLVPYPFIHMSRTSSVRQYLDAAFHPQSMRTVMEVDQLSTVTGMVRAGLGISVVPALALFHFDHPEIVTRPLSMPGLQRRIYVVRRRDRSLSAAAQRLHDLALEMRPGTASKQPRRAPRAARRTRGQAASEPSGKP